MIVLNAAHVLKDPAGSATDFQRLNDKDQLLMEEEYQTKNDGNQHYFELRTVFHEKLRKKVQEMMKDVKFFLATLDKVTVGVVGYTVVCTYYFWHGGLKVFMNELLIMSSDMSDGEGAAKMLCQSLMKTLGLSKEELAEKLEHVSFDRGKIISRPKLIFIMILCSIRRHRGQSEGRGQSQLNSPC